MKKIRNYCLFLFIIIAFPVSALYSEDKISPSAPGEKAGAGVEITGDANQEEQSVKSETQPAEEKSSAEEKSAHHGAEGFDINEVLEHHLMDGAPVIPIDWNYGGEKIQILDPKDAPAGAVAYPSGDGNYHYYTGGLNLNITRRVMVMWAVCILLILTLAVAARKITKNPLRPAGRFSGFIEALVQFVRKDIAEKNMGHHGDHYHPYLLSLFFFILFSNLIGLLPNVGETAQLVKDLILPGGGSHSEYSLIRYLPIITPTGDVSVTASLAFLTFILIWIGGFKSQGLAYIKNIVPNGVPAPLWILMWPLELISPVAKCFSLTIRLLANMTAGHVIIIALLGLIFQYKNAFIGFGSVPGSVAIYLLEIFVCFLQAYIFTLLSALFIGSSFHRH